MTDLVSLAHSHLEAAHASAHGRSAELIVRDGVLRQSIVALVSGTELAEHNSPPAASLQVLSGRVRVTGFDSPELSVGELTVLTHRRHAVTALEDSVFLLTTVTGVAQEAAPEQA